MTEALNDLTPRDALYARLRKELVTLVSDPDRAKEVAGPIRFDGVLRPGDFARDVPKLRERLI